MTQSPHVIETTPENFVSDVVERSNSAPVVVDFWAEWCQPCRILGPTLEKLATEFDGQFTLVKANTETMPEVASAFGVRSIPAVFGVRDGKVVGSFVGVLPEASVRSWIEKLMPTPAEILIKEAAALEEADPEGAERKYRQALELVPEDVTVQLGLGRMALTLGRPEEARATIQQLERRGFLEPEAETLKAKLTLEGHAGEDLASLRAALESQPKDRSLQLRLAEALAAEGQHAEALALALDLVERDRRGTGEPARKLMLAVFQLLPADSELVAEYRRKLSVAL